jgi:hypothetical protein
MSLSLLIASLKSGSSLYKLKYYFKLMPKLVIILFSSSSLILMAFTASYIVYNKPLVLSSTLIIAFSGRGGRWMISLLLSVPNIVV